MSSERDALNILQHNLGFREPEQWVDYAIQHCFSHVKATPVPNCPDCGRAPSRAIGQYIYYSTLIHLDECRSCHLIWADAHLASQVVRAHFESSYKDHDYFVNARLPIFRQLAAYITRVAPTRGKILDIGGAQGHLMHLVKQRRPDLETVVHDLSETATQYAAERFHLPTLCGDLEVLRRHTKRYDIIVLSDVLYYEPCLTEFWSFLPQVLAPGGSVIIRVPNKFLFIRVGQALRRLVGAVANQSLQDSVKYFNPEHIYILRRKYLKDRFKMLGFKSVCLSSPLLSSKSKMRRALKHLYFRGASALNLLSGGLLVLTPSMVIIGKYNPERKLGEN